MSEVEKCFLCDGLGAAPDGLKCPLCDGRGYSETVPDDWEYDGDWFE